MSTVHPRPPVPAAPAKFRDPDRTAKGEPRAVVALSRLRTLWFNTGSRCNLACPGCYMESGPDNGRLAYLSVEDVLGSLDEARAAGLALEEVGLTGGEPFLNPAIAGLIEESARRDLKVLVLTNATRPLWNRRDALARLARRYGVRIMLRVSLDHYTAERHESLRGRGSWDAAWRGLTWLAHRGFRLAVAARGRWQEGEDALRAGFAELFAERALPLDADDPSQLVLFPELTDGTDVPEISTACWGILGVAPDSVMCADSRMMLKRAGADAMSVVPCTLLPYDQAFEMGTRLADAARPVALNHPHCARFCVLGRASCSRS